MPILDLSIVTQALLSLIKRRLEPVLPPGVTLKVSPLPPDKLEGEATVGLYLYHVTESAHTRNQPPPSADHPPIQFTPMCVELHYQLTVRTGAANDDSAGAQAIEREQMLFGLALKALHDFPVIDKNTKVNGVLVFKTPEVTAFVGDLPDTGDRLRISLEPIAVKDAAYYWTAGAQPLRLAAYYQVSATLLEPETPARFAGRVLRYGVQTFVRGAPRFDASTSLVAFRVPGETTDRIVEARPAEASVGQQVVFAGSDLAGDETTLMVRLPGQDTLVEVGAEWGVTATEDRAFATIQRLAAAAEIVPGGYSAAIKVTRRRTLPDGSLRAFAQSSNEIPFVAAPALTTPGTAVLAEADPATGMVVVQGHLFRHASFLAGTVKVIVGADSLVLNDPAQHPLAAGEFEIVDGRTPLVPAVVLDDLSLPFVIRFRFPLASATPADVLPLRVLVNGAENAPRWVKVP